ncbi:vesicle-associated membrane protein 7-like [Dysidea avara]|uniref:vesicle-associated membrane protein 7-like n=1 Tax=Dysidea avara TaxID=196820 RepID=UPI003330CEC7
MAGDNEGILYCSVTEGDRVLSQYSSTNGNFKEFGRKVLEKAGSQDCDKATYASGNYMLHYMRDGEIVYICITDDEFERSRAFLFLSDIRRRFVHRCKQAKLMESKDNFADIISEQMEYYSKRYHPQLESASVYARQLSELADIEVHDMGSMYGEHDHVRLLPLPPIASTNFDFEDSQSVTSSGAFIPVNSQGGFPCKRNQQTLILCLLVLLTILVVAFFATVGICKGFNYKECR